MHARPLPEAPREPAARFGFDVAARAWLDSRPFWAGLCLVVAGIEIGFWPAVWVTQRAGVSSIMFMVLLVSDGLAVWLVPLYRRLLGVQAAALGILALTTENVGGLVVGTAAAVLGGAMAFRWQPSTQSSASRLVAPPVERALKAVPAVRAEDAGAPAEAEVEQAAEPEVAPKLAIVGGTEAPELAEPTEPTETGAGRHEARRPRPAASTAEDELVAHIEHDEQSFIPGF